MFITITAEHEFCGRDVLSFLKSLSLSSKMIKYLKYRNDGIQVNGEHVTVRYILKNGDILSLTLEDRSSSKTATPSPLPLDIIYEDDSIIVANKPPFMPTHPSHGHHEDTLANALAYYFSQKSLPFVFRPINRLDRNTSGLVIVAKNKISAAKMTDNMKKGYIKKSYIAILKGQMPDPEVTTDFNGMTLGVIDRPVRRTAKSIILREVCRSEDEGAESALTYYRILERSDGYTKVEAFPQTGRTHQLRVHFASLGFPIIGDDMYGTDDDFIDRHALHAHTLSFPNPNNQSSVLHLSAPIPEDMKKAEKKHFSK